MPSIKRVWALGGIPAYYRGLVVRGIHSFVCTCLSDLHLPPKIGLIGVFPYSAIDMSTFEALKLAYVRSTGNSEPGVLALLAFGSVSGSVGATSVYPMNLVRTRLQASGSSGHPERYDGVADVVKKTYAREGWKGFYKGLIPTLAKVRSYPVWYTLSYALLLNQGSPRCIHIICCVRKHEATVSDPVHSSHQSRLSDNGRRLGVA